MSPFSWGIGSQTRFLDCLVPFSHWRLSLQNICSDSGSITCKRVLDFVWPTASVEIYGCTTFRIPSSACDPNLQGRILEEINGWPILFARVFITGGQLYFNELVVMALLAIGLTAYSPMVFLGVASIIGTGGLLIRWLTKRRLQRNSATLRTIAPQATSLVSNAVRGFLELVTFRAVRAMQANYLSKTRKLYAVHSNQLVLGIAPARLYEFLAVSALCTAIIVSLTFGMQVPPFLNPSLCSR